MSDWLLLVYKVPNEPSARRVYVWRKLKQLGAILLHDAVWVLPATPYTRERLQWLAAEIFELEGEAYLWEARQLFHQQAEKIREQFKAQVDTAYREMLAELNGENPDLAALSKRYQQVQSQDYFQSDTGQEVREALLRARGMDEA